MPGRSPGIGLPYDLEQARQLLAEAGYPGDRGLPALLAILPSGYGRGTAFADYAEPQWQQELGVDLRREYASAAEYRRHVRQERPHLSRMGWSADYPDPDNFLRVGFENEGTGWRDEEYDRLVGEARQLLDKEEWMALYQRADRILIREAPFLATRYGQSHFLLKSWVKRYAMLPIAIWSPWKDAVIEPH